MSAEYRRVCFTRTRDSTERGDLLLHTRKATEPRVKGFSTPPRRAPMVLLVSISEQEAGTTRMALRRPGQDS